MEVGEQPGRPVGDYIDDLRAGIVVATQVDVTLLQRFAQLSAYFLTQDVDRNEACAHFHVPKGPAIAGRCPHDSSTHLVNGAPVIC